MEKPVIFAVDDDPVVLRAVVRDLRSRYGSDYRILRADGGQAAVDALRELQRRQDAVALLLVDQRMPQMNGIEFIVQAKQIYPDAKRALLTAYADTEAAIGAINEAAVDYYLLKPWDPPEEKLYPIIDDLLLDWRTNYRPPFEGIRLVGHRWSPQTHVIKDFLSRNQIPYQYLDVESNAEASEVLKQFEVTSDKLPVLIMPDGVLLVEPSAADLANRIGLTTQAKDAFYDMVIVGGGPAGLAAAVYGASEGLRTVMIEKKAPGGQAGTSSRIENYLGFPSGVSGSELARRASVQAKRFGVEILSPQEACGIRIDGPYRFIQLMDGGEIACHALVVASGLDYRTLEIENIDRLTGAGVYYGASITEVETCRDQPVFIVGAGNSAGQAAMYLINYAKEVTIVVRGDSLEAKMSQYLVQRIYDHPRIHVMLNSHVVGVDGSDHLEQVTVRDESTGKEVTTAGSGLFIFIGAIPSTQWLRGAVKMDKHGFVLAGPGVMENGKRPADWPLDRDPFLLEASVPGIFVVGDVRASSVKRVASAVGEGSIAVQFIHQYLSKL